MSEQDERPRERPRLKRLIIAGLLLVALVAIVYYGSNSAMRGGGGGGTTAATEISSTGKKKAFRNKAAYLKALGKYKAKIAAPTMSGGCDCAGPEGLL